MAALTTHEQRIIEDNFEKRVNKSRRRSMVDFLTKHFRYHTMNACNKSTSYAHNIKLTQLKGIIPDDIIRFDLGETALAMLDCTEWHAHMSGIMDDFDKTYSGTWQVGVNGHSGGYIVLYQGGIKEGRLFCQPGLPIDQDKDFHDWNMNDLKNRVMIIQDFDMLVSDIVMDFCKFCRSYDVVETVISVPKTIKILQEKNPE